MRLWPPAAARGFVTQMTDEGTAALREAGLQPGKIQFSFGADLRYLGQQSELRIDLPFARARGPRSHRDARDLQARRRGALRPQTRRYGD